MKGEETVGEFESVRNSLLADPADADAYVRLGDLYYPKNINQAYLCYELAGFHESSPEKQHIISNLMKKAENDGAAVRPVSVVIVSYNSKDAQIGCIESIRMNNPPKSYEIIVVDNASTDGITQWLEEQPDIKLRKNTENLGFGPASNQGVAMAAPGNDIFFLNNDTIVLPGSIFWLRMGLYENENVGAIGSVSNNVSYFQRVDEPIDTLEGWMAYGIRNNVPQENPYERKITLVGFAILAKRSVIDTVGLFDEIYGIGNFEDDDLCMRIRKCGYEIILCHNSFIYHFGSLGFKQRDEQSYNELINRNQALFMNKWGFDINTYKPPGMDITEHIEPAGDGNFTVLEIGCGFGATLYRIAYEHPGAVVKGITENSKIADIVSATTDITYRDREHLFDIGDEKYDYIILGDITKKIDDLAGTLTKISSNLNENGRIILRLYNIMHVSVLLPLLRGKFDIGGKRYYTIDSAVDIFKRANLTIDKLTGTRGYEDELESERELWDLLEQKLGDDFSAQALTYNYVIRVRPR